eukprot:Hpha_TRINITY_DN16652_c3_g15::TRINITY_DN16652_c3_g15_i1::g.181856::m.181856/K13101/GPKOW; G patch domain and KOW motifs-containing protein
MPSSSPDPPQKHLLFRPEDDDNDDAAKVSCITVPVIDDFVPAGGDVDDTERLRQDLAKLPDAQDPSTITASPLAIAEAMLRGMVRRDGTQWKVGEPLLGGGLKEAQVPVPRAQGVGLGCPSSTVLPGRRGAGRGELLVAASDGDKKRSHVGVSETLVRQRRVENGEFVVLTGGPHRGAHAVVIECPQPLREADRVKVRLCLGGTDVSARSGHVRLRLERDMEPEAKKARAESPPPMNTSAAPPLRWCLWPGMLVRYIDQSRGGGRYYNIKMQVLDVSSPQTVTLLAPGGETLDNVLESQVETVIPKAAGSGVMIVKGKKAGKRGTMMSRDKAAQEVSVTLDDSLTKQYRLGFDAICALSS